MGHGIANVAMPGHLTTGSFNSPIMTAGTYILANGSGFYARNGFDARLYCSGAGTFLDMGNVGSDGNPTFLRFGAFNSQTELQSVSNRRIQFRVAPAGINSVGGTWEFNADRTTWNALNSTVWQQTSDHRIKENIKKADLKICFNNVKNINLYRFSYIEGFKDGTTKDKIKLGHIAQQVWQHFPKSVSNINFRMKDKREIPDLASIDVEQINLSLFGAVKQLIKIVEKQIKRIKKLEEMLNIIDDDEVEDDADEPYIKIECDQVDIDTIEPSEPTEV